MSQATNTVPILVSDKILGIEHVDANDFYLYPNPTKGEVNIVMPSDLKGKVILTIYNAQGKAVKEEIFAASVFNKFSMDLTDLPKGIYFLKWNNSQLQKTSKIIKQ